MADWADKRARLATHKEADECPHCREVWNECGICDGTVTAVAQALREARAEGMKEAAKIIEAIECIASRKAAEAIRKAASGEEVAK